MKFLKDLKYKGVIGKIFTYKSKLVKGTTVYEMYIKTKKKGGFLIAVEDSEDTCKFLLHEEVNGEPEALVKGDWDPIEITQ